MNVVCIGAHPDDAEAYAGGTLIKWAAAGHRVWAVCTTRGDLGHHAMHGDALALRRRAETERAAALGGYTAVVLEHADGAFQPTLEARAELVRLIRRCGADLVLTHRPNDYHPDHRYTSMAVQDAAYMVCVPHYCADTHALPRNPVFAYLHDRFTRPQPFRADIAVDVSAVHERRIALLDAMDSQFYEWLPWIEQWPETAPPEAAARPAWLRRMLEPFHARQRAAAAPALERRYGDAAAGIAHAECFELCEYGRNPAPDELEALFPR